MESHLVSQRQAAAMLQKAGLSRRAAYYRLDRMESREFLDTKVYSRVDIDLLIEQMKLDT